MFDNSEFTAIIEKLEALNDEELAAKLLSKFSKSQSRLSTLLLNNDESLSHDKWKDMCDKEKIHFENILEEINDAFSNN